MSPTEVFVAGLRRRLGAEVGPAARVPAGTRALIDQGVRDVASFLAGRRSKFDLPLDLAGLAAWDRLVLDGVRGINYGEVTSYGRLARRIGRPGAARAVGGAVGRNPIGLFIPCHRVIAGDGSLGGYGGDWFGSRAALLEVKRSLLEREGIRLPVTFASTG